MIKSVLLLGYHGLNNVGADARLEVVVNLLNKHYKSFDVSYATCGTKVKNVDAKEIQLSFYNLYYKLFNKIRKTDVLIIDEGSPFRDSVGSAYLYFFLINILYAKIFRKKIILYSVSIDKLKRLNFVFAKWLLRNVDLITARTQNSYEIFKGMRVNNLYLSSDCAISFPKKDVHIKFSSKKKIGLVIKEEFGFPVMFKLFGEEKDRYHSHFFFTYSQKNSLSQLNYLRGIVDYIDCKMSEGCEIYLLDFEPEIDKNSTLQIMNRVKNASKIKHISALDYTPAQMKTFLLEMDCLITSRLHPFVLSLEFQIPCIAIHRGSKLYGIFKDAGLQDYLVGYNEMIVADKLLYLTNKIEKNKKDVRNKLKNVYKDYVAKNNYQEKLLIDFLNKD